MSAIEENAEPTFIQPNKRLGIEDACVESKGQPLLTNRFCVKAGDKKPLVSLKPPPRKQAAPSR